MKPVRTLDWEVITCSLLSEDGLQLLTAFGVGNERVSV